MDIADTAEDSYSKIQSLIQKATYRNCFDLGHRIEDAVAEIFKGVTVSYEARAAAADVILECRALEQDLMLAGENPSDAWQESLDNSCDRAILAANRMSMATVGCERFVLPTHDFKAPSFIAMRRSHPSFAWLAATGPHGAQPNVSVA